MRGDAVRFPRQASEGFRAGECRVHVLIGTDGTVAEVESAVFGGEVQWRGEVVLPPHHNMTPWGRQLPSTGYELAACAKRRLERPQRRLCRSAGVDLVVSTLGVDVDLNAVLNAIERRQCGWLPEVVDGGWIGEVAAIELQRVEE